MEETGLETGAFLDSLKRNNKQIREDRAQAIGEDAQIVYKRRIEDMQMKLKRLKRDRENMLDMSGDNALSLKVATDFDADVFTQTDLRIGVEIRELEIQLEIAEKRYDYLFGGA